MSGIVHSYVWRGAFRSVSGLVRVRVRVCVCVLCVYVCVSVCVCVCRWSTPQRVTWRIHMSDMAQSYV